MHMPTADRLQSKLLRTPRFVRAGKVVKVVGLVIESTGPEARLGDLVHISTGKSRSVAAEVVGFRDGRTLIMPLRDVTGVKPGDLVYAKDRCVSVQVGPELLGRVVDGLGAPIDDLGPISCGKQYPTVAEAPNPLQRQMIEQPFETGVRSIDALMTIGIGQRVGVFAGSGVGKSTLMGMIARNSEADVVVIALIGERGRELKEFIENDLGEEGRKKAVIVCATSDQPALLRIKAAYTATAVAEYFRDQGLSVLLMMDSVTRFAMAQREVGLASGEPPSSRGYTPSVFAALPKLMERTGRSDKGSITAIYTVLVDGDDTNEPLADAARSILDGHIVLDRKLTSSGHYPPIDPLQSLSRVMPMVTSGEHQSDASKIRALMAAYDEIKDLISVGAYKPGSSVLYDSAIDKREQILGLLKQDKAEATPLSATVEKLRAISAEIEQFDTTDDEVPISTPNDS